jgi:hypothetical protein
MTVLTPLPDAPSISDPANFQTKADAFVAALNVLVNQINGLGTPGLGGGTMTGPLILNADPTVALGAATKQYVDGKVSGYMVITNNGSDINNVGTFRNNLGLKTGAVTNITVSASSPSGGADGDIWIQ